MKCPYCYSTSFHPPFTVMEMVNESKEAFDYQECAVCGTVTICNFPSNISAYYKNYYSFSKSFSQLETNKNKQIIAFIFKWLFVRTGLLIFLKPIFKYPPILLMNNLNWNLQSFLYSCTKYDHLILDVGSGYGEFVDITRRFGYVNIHGIDPFLPVEKETLFIQSKKINEILPTKLYDTIIFNHSLEHVDDPDDQVKMVSHLIKSSGMVIIHIPNMNSLDRDHFKGSWWLYHAPFHYSIPTRSGLEIMADRHGLKIKDSICTSRWDHYLYSQEYRNGIGDNSPHSVRRQIEQGQFGNNEKKKMQKMARALNVKQQGESISYYLIKK